MVVKVTSCGGDVIKFAGDCIIAVFPADDYVRQRLCLVCSHRLRVAKAAPSALCVPTAFVWLRHCPWPCGHQVDKAAELKETALQGGHGTGSSSGMFKKPHTISTLALATGQASSVAHEMVQVRGTKEMRCGWTRQGCIISLVLLLISLVPP